MKNNGFTLIELLAVIVILAIIALIASPIILGIIKVSKEESNKRSIEMYASALKNAIAENQLGGQELEISKLKVDYNGDVVCKTVEIYKDGNIYLAECKVNAELVEYTYGKKQSYDNGQIVYYDVVKGIGCSEQEYKSSYDETIQDYLNSKTDYNGIRDKYDDEKMNSCLKFYAFNDKGGEKLNLLLDHNIRRTTQWADASDYDDEEKWSNGLYNLKGPVSILWLLYQLTKNWNVPEISNNYLMNQSLQTSQANYTVQYTKIPKYEGAITPYKARLITAQEIAEITGADKVLNWNESLSSSSGYKFDTLTEQNNPNCTDNNESTLCPYGWLYDRTNNECKEKYGCINNVESSISLQGYWTSSSDASSTFSAWYVFYQGSLSSSNTVKVNGYYGLRPVIEVLKSSLK